MCVSITFMVSTASSPPGLFQVEPSISAAGLLHFRLAHGQAGRATVVLSARDDGGSDFDGSDTSPEEVLTIQILPVCPSKTSTLHSPFRSLLHSPFISNVNAPYALEIVYALVHSLFENLYKLPSLTSVSPMWWMANEVNATQVALTVRGAYLSPSAHAQGRGETRVSRQGFLALPPLPGTYVMVDGQACEESELISDSEVRCHGFLPFARSAEVKVRVLEPPSENQVINSEKYTPYTASLQ